jgi:hypothetical protein
MTCKPNAEKQALVNAAVEKLRSMNIKHSLTAAGTHIIVHGPAGEVIDLWPTTCKWMRRGQGVSQGMFIFWKAVADWGQSDGA